MVRDDTQDMCLELCIHKNVVDAVRKNMPDDDTLLDMAEIFKAFGDLTRTKIISALLETELCVCDISDIVGLSASAVSHQARILRQTKLVKSRRQGKEVYYSLDDSHIAGIYKTVLEHLLEERNV